MMFLHVSDAVCFQQIEKMWVSDDPLQLLDYALARGYHIYNRSQFVFLQKFIAFWLSASHHDDAFAHSQQRIHGWRITIELVEHHVATVHRLFILCIRQTLHLDHFAEIGIPRDYLFQGREHDVCALVLASLLVYSYKETHAPPIEFMNRSVVVGFDGKWNELGLVRKIARITRLILIDTGRNPVGVFHHVAGVFAFWRVVVVVDEFLGGCICAHLVADVEVAIAESFVVEAIVHPIPVAAESPCDDSPIVSAQKAVEGIFSFCLQSEALRIDELHDVVVPKFGQETQQPKVMLYP